MDFLSALSFISVLGILLGIFLFAFGAMVLIGHFFSNRTLEDIERDPGAHDVWKP